MFNWCVGECTQILFWPGKRPWGRALFEVASHVPLVVLGECTQFFFLSRFGGNRFVQCNDAAVNLVFAAALLRKVDLVLLSMQKK